MTRIGFIGLGLMGGPMAARLVEAGHDVAVTSRRHDPDGAALVAGASWRETPAELADRELILTMLPSGTEVEDVLVGAQGVFSGGLARALVTDMSTIGPIAADRIAAEVVACGGSFADAPVSGGPAGAAGGTLAIMVGASASDYERVAPVLSALGTPRLLGAVGSGQSAKLANQALIAGIIGGIADALSLASSRGLDLGGFHEAVRGGLGGSPLLDWVMTRIGAGDDAPGFKIAHFLKDLDLVAEAAASGSADARVSALMRDAYAELGPGALDLGTQRLPSSRLATRITDHGEPR